MDTYVYQIGSSLYVNLTNRCSNHCLFCAREQSPEYQGYSLWLKEGEPTAEQIIQSIGNPSAYREIVFCGYGEPTYRLDVMLAVCKYVHDCRGKTRLNTNGHGNLINGRNIAPELKGAIDRMNISLNAPDEEDYVTVCRPTLDGAFDATIGFARDCKAAEINCWFSVVDCIGEAQIARCRAIAESVGIPLRIREMIP